MTPKEYASKFLELDVFMFSGENPTSFDDGSWKRTKVSSYRLGASYDPAKNPLPAPGPDGTVGPRQIVHPYQDDLTSAVKGHSKIKVKVKRIDGVEETGTFEYSDLAYAMVAPFSGKGYPEEVQILLQERYRFQKTTFALDDFVKAEFIGLDCNGFVGGYLERRSTPSVWRRTSASKTSMPIASILGPEQGFFTSWDDFRPPAADCIVMGMCTESGDIIDHSPDGGVGHITITEPGTMIKESPTGPVKVGVVESTGMGVGLTYSEYKILSMTKDRKKRAIFYVQRGSKKGTPYEYEYFRMVQV